MIFIDKVIIVCSNRLEAVQVMAIKRCMEWLKFKDHKDNFSFILNKSDNLTENERTSSLAFMCEKLDFDLTKCFEETRDDFTYQIPLNQALGFPRDATYQKVEDSLKNLMAITLTETMPDNKRIKRIELHPRQSKCIIQ
jgi:2-oxoglutarate dehydrogenase complex dehydrogenase (E1) component-like enzyme